MTEKRLRHLEPMVSQIDAQTLNEKIEAEEIFKLIEVSKREDFENGHIKGAIHIPIEQLIPTARQRFRTFQQIIVYSEEADSSVGMHAARLLQSLGFSNVTLLRGGKEAWKESGLPLDSDVVSEHVESTEASPTTS